MDALRSMGAERIILVGPVPHWEGTLPEVLSHYVGDHHLSALPGRMSWCIN